MSSTSPQKGHQLCHRLLYEKLNHRSSPKPRKKSRRITLLEPLAVGSIGVGALEVDEGEKPSLPAGRGAEGGEKVNLPAGIEAGDEREEAGIVTESGGERKIRKRRDQKEGKKRSGDLSGPLNLWGPHQVGERTGIGFLPNLPTHHRSDRDRGGEECCL